MVLTVVIRILKQNLTKVSLTKLEDLFAIAGLGVLIG